MKAKAFLSSFFLLKKIVYPSVISIILCMGYYFPVIHRISAGIALLAGMLLSILFSNPYVKTTQKLASTLLVWSVVGLGFGMNLLAVVKVGKQGISYTFFSILICTGIGLTLGKVLKNPKKASILITFGTAICGGSAIAAIAPIIRAKPEEITVALAVVFLLNAISLFIFPLVGHHFQMNQMQFGLWSALAIQDTSSVVGTTLQFGPKALDIGTTVKLARALWIVPLTLFISRFYRYSSENNAPSPSNPKKPWFILGFILASALTTWVPGLKTTAGYLHHLAEQGLVIALFCIGANLSSNIFQTVGVKPFIQGTLLWGIMAFITFLMIT